MARERVAQSRWYCLPPAAFSRSYLSVGQYLAPSRAHEAVREFIAPEQFDRYRRYALELGFVHVESGPYVRSSYLAERYLGVTTET